jgi:HPt (histidine-containing phosphotransfer) domain-containing protein
VDEADLREVLAVFLLDAPGRLDRIELHLEALERARLPSERAAAVAAATHEAHSLSGAAGTLRLEPVAARAERMELVLRDDEVGAGGRAFAKRVRDELDTIAGIVAALDLEVELAAAPRPAGPTKRTVLHVEDNPAHRPSPMTSRRRRGARATSRASSATSRRSATDGCVRRGASVTRAAGRPLSARHRVTPSAAAAR